MNLGIDKIAFYQRQGYRIYIYGAGLWGRNVYQELKNNGIKIDGFVVTRIDGIRSIFGIQVEDFFSLEHENIMLVLGLNQHNTKEVCQFLREQNFDEDRIVYADDVMGINDVRCGYDEIPCLDITTKIGCSINCRYCPQAVLLKEYFKDNPNRDVYLRKDVFIKCIDNMPMDANFQFGGMSEPFLNPDCVELLRLACEKKRTVNLYTTLVGLDEKKLQQVMELPIDYVTLHVADAKGYAMIPTTDEYYRLLQMAVNHKKSNGRPFVDMCNAQAEPTKRVGEICKERYAISSTLIDRAGNLCGDNLVSKRIQTGRISCGVCGKALNKNELLPDGTLLLCCMDYGMKHVLGNLKERSYGELIEGEVIKNIRDGMEFDYTKDILCRSCSCANLEE